MCTELENSPISKLTSTHKISAQKETEPAWTNTINKQTSPTRGSEHEMPKEGTTKVVFIYNLNKNCNNSMATKQNKMA